MLLSYNPLPLHQQHSKQQSALLSLPPSNANSSFYHHISPISPVSKDFNQLTSRGITPASSVVFDTSNLPVNNLDLFMPSALDFQANNHNSSYQLSDASGMWNQLGGGNMAVANAMGSVNRGVNNHQRLPSTSSIGSAASQSPYQGQRSRMQSNDQKQRGIGQRHARNPSTSRSHLPTPSQTPTRNNFASPTDSNFNHQGQDMNSTVAASFGLHQAVDQKHQGDDVPHLTNSARPSFSSVGQGPATPLAAIGDHHEDQSTNNDMMNHNIPKLERTVTDAYNDELFFPQNMHPSQTHANSYLMPTANKTMAERLAEAEMARSVSSGSYQSGGRSPFPANRGDGSDQSSQYNLSPQSASEPQTISPKEAMLDYKPDQNEMALFPQSTTGFANNFSAIAGASSYPMRQPSISYTDMSNSQGWNSIPQASISNTQSFNFATPSLPNHLSSNSVAAFMGNMPQHSGRTLSRQASDQVPEFPAQLTSMESSSSEAPPSSQQSSMSQSSAARPISVTADAGTYSCTYGGCNQRFQTPQKLQRHKRDVHRAMPAVTPGVGSGMSTQELLERNSQQGPHKCFRTNPQTGKPCNQIFSRPYDLTRHEDTIHNNRKVKSRCALCTEEKLFSRNDALTRHMRVVHPEVEFPGKHRKRGMRSD